MSYISFEFAFLVIGLLIVYYVLPKKWNLQWAVLLLGSLAFYLCFDLKYSIFILFTTLSTFFCSIADKEITRLQTYSFPVYCCQCSSVVCCQSTSVDNKNRQLSFE